MSLAHAAAVALCLFQDEATELISEAKTADSTEPHQALTYLSQHCEVAVVTLGDKGCIAKKKGDEAVVQEPACSGVTVIDATGMSNAWCQVSHASSLSITSAVLQTSTLWPSNIA